MNKLVQFLFGESQVVDALAGIEDDFVSMFENAERQEKLQGKKAPLANALSSAGINGSSLELDPDGFVAVVDDEAEYRAICSKLQDPATMTKLAELGWVALPVGDVAMTREPAELRIRFLEIDTAETGDADAAGGVQSILKAAHDFAAKSDLPKADEDPGFKPGKAEFGGQKDGDDAKPPPVKKTKHEGLVVDEILPSPDSELIEILEKHVASKSRSKVSHHITPATRRKKPQFRAGVFVKAANRPNSGNPKE